MRNPNHPIWRAIGISLGIVLIVLSVLQRAGKVETYLMGVGAIFVSFAGIPSELEQSAAT
jgi:hypothetical protein